MIFIAAVGAFIAAWLLIPDPIVMRIRGLNSVGTPGWNFVDMYRRLESRLRGDSRRVRAQREDTIAAIGALAAELRAGATPAQALAVTGGNPPVWPQAKAAASHHGDISTALMLDARDNPELTSLHACWYLGFNAGSGLAMSISRLAHSLREAQETRIQLEAELAGPRATAKMLAFLPVIGIGLGYLLGAEPLSWLLSSLLGWATLVTGITLTGLGMWWTSSIAAKVERML